jgi:tetratricopeptide (TPR) repeat protein
MSEPTQTSPPGPEHPTATLGPATDGGASAPRCAPPGYELLGLVGSGGMGLVYRARDVELARDVAVKVLQDRFGPESPAAGRFLDEARITAQLQHPGIPPVFKVGTLPDGRPFLAMKLIKGDTLDDELKARGGPDSEPGRFLAIFEQVAQAVGYAHAHQVIHRDLKPQNVMVGAYGEVQVMDWGLAKLIDPARPAAAQRPAAEETWGTRIVPTREADSATETGSLLGTPAFMPPEQAAGAVELIGPRADVFGLGALLCVILTGKPPYTGDPEAVRLAAIQGKLAAAHERLGTCGAEADLIALCKRCLAADPAERPADAGEVASAVNAFRGEAEARARQAEIDRERAAVREAERRKRRRVIVTAATLLVVVGGAAAWVARQRSEERAVARARAEEGASAALAQAENALTAGKMPEADAALAQVETRLDDAARPELRDRYDSLRRDREVARELEDIAERRWTVFDAKTRWVGTNPSIARWFDGAFRRYGLAVGEGDPAEAAERVRTSRVSGALVAGLNEWFFLAPKQPGLQAGLDRADPDPVRVEVRAAVSAGQGERVRGLAAKIDAAALTPGFAVALGMHPAISDEEGYRLMRAAWDAHPDSFGLALRIGTRSFALASGGDPERAREAAAWTRTAIALRPRSAVAHNNLGAALGEIGDQGGQEWALRQAVALGPDLVLAHTNLIHLRRKKGELGAALADARRLVERAPDSAEAYAALGEVCKDRRDYPAAAGAYHKAIELAPKNPVAHYNLGMALRELKDYPAAAAEFRAAAALRRADDPWRHRDLAWALKSAGDDAGAADACRAAVAIAPDDPLLRNDLGLILRDLKDHAGAAASFRRSIELAPKNPWTHLALGDDLRAMKDYPAATAAYRKAMELDPKNPDYRRALGDMLHYDLHDDAAAAAEFRAAATLLKENDPWRHAYLGWALRLGRDFARSADAYRKAAALAPDSAKFHADLGGALLDLKDYPAAAATFRRVIELNPSDGNARKNLATALAPLGRLEEARAAWGKALEQDPPRHDDWFGYAELCLFLGREGEYRKARAALLRKFGDTGDPTVAERTARACLLLPAEGAELDRAAALADRAVAAGPAHGYYGYFLAAKGLAEYRRGHYAEAIDALQQAERRFGVWRPVSEPVLAMARRRKGRTEEAESILSATLMAGGPWEDAGASGHDVWIHRVLCREAEALILPRLPDLLAGKYEPADNRERLALVSSCYVRGRYAAAARLLAAALAAGSKVGGVRYNAACSAALAGCGRGSDAPAPEAERARLRRQSLDWLRAELAGVKDFFNADPGRHALQVRGWLGEWLADGDFAPIRDPKLLAEMPPDERAGWEKLWADVRALLARAAPDTAPPPREVRR